MNFLTTCRHLFPRDSESMYEILGMNLLNLLSQANKMAEFHMALELFHPHLDKALQDPYIKKAVEIEQCITEGKYNKVCTTLFKI